MPVTNIDRLEAALAAITRDDIAALPPARRRSLQATLGAWGCLCDDIPGAAGVTHEGRHGFAPGTLNDVYRPTPTPGPAANGMPKSCGVLADLRDGRGRR
jgi:hypothetical protein